MGTRCLHGSGLESSDSGLVQLLCVSCLMFHVQGLGGTETVWGYWRVSLSLRLAVSVSLPLSLSSSLSLLLSRALSHTHIDEHHHTLA